MTLSSREWLGVAERVPQREVVLVHPADGPLQGAGDLPGERAEDARDLTVQAGQAGQLAVARLGAGRVVVDRGVHRREVRLGLGAGRRRGEDAAGGQDPDHALARGQHRAEHDEAGQQLPRGAGQHQPPRPAVPRRRPVTGRRRRMTEQVRRVR